jgi:hypothetical protein
MSMPTKVERFGAFYLEIDEEIKQVELHVDERNLKLLSRESLKENYQKITGRLLQYKRNGYQIDDDHLKPIHRKVAEIIYR